jgi:hypothetical protein
MNNILDSHSAFQKFKVMNGISLDGGETCSRFITDMKFDKRVREIISDKEFCDYFDKKQISRYMIMEICERVKKASDDVSLLRHIETITSNPFSFIEKYAEKYAKKNKRFVKTARTNWKGAIEEFK